MIGVPALDKPEVIVRILQLQPLEGEGGMFRRIWARDGEASAIYYMLEGEQFSHLHRLKCDEIYTHIAGSALELLEIKPDGTASCHDLGGQEPVVVLPRGSWQGSRLKNGGEWGLVSTVCTPEYTEDSYEHCTHNSMLIAQNPEFEELIRALCPET